MTQAIHGIALTLPELNLKTGKYFGKYTKTHQRFNTQHTHARVKNSKVTQVVPTLRHSCQNFAQFVISSSHLIAIFG
jgi:hypothetical protein